MKCLNLYAVFCTPLASGKPGNPESGSLVHYPVFVNDAGEQHIHFAGSFKPLAEMKGLVRTEHANLGN